MKSSLRLTPAIVPAHLQKIHISDSVQTNGRSKHNFKEDPFLGIELELDDEEGIIALVG
jgi:hypothetical protein